MYCPRCQKKMDLQTHRPHKQEKWRCERCRIIRMRPARYRRVQNSMHWKER